MTGKKFLGLSPKVWIGVLAIGVVVFIYIKHKSSSSAVTPAVDPNATDSVNSTDPASLAAGLGGTPAVDTGGFDTSWLASLFDQQTQSLQDFIANQGLMAGAGISGAGGSGVAGTVPAAAASPTVGSPIVANAAQQPATTDVANPATSFYAPDSNAAVGGAAPLYAYNGGTLIAESPIAGSAFSSAHGAAQGYEALGADPSGPITFLPTPMGPTNTYTGSLTASGGYQSFTQAPSVGQKVAS